MIDNTFYIFAARYAHHRNTGAAYAVVQRILADWDTLDLPTRQQLIREASEATHCEDDWKRLIAKGEGDG